MELPVGAALAAGVVAGDQGALRNLYQAYAGAIFTVARRITGGDRSAAEEAVQQTFLQFWRSRDQLDPTRDPAPWLFTIARRVAIDVARHEGRRRHEMLEDTVPGGGNDGSVHLEQAWEAARVRAAVDALPTEEREIVRLQHFEGMTHAAIATRLGVAVGTVKSRSHRAHRRLLGQLEHLKEVTA